MLFLAVTHLSVATRGCRWVQAENIHWKKKVINIAILTLLQTKSYHVHIMCLWPDLHIGLASKRPQFETVFQCLCEASGRCGILAFHQFWARRHSLSLRWDQWRFNICMRSPGYNKTFSSYAATKKQVFKAKTWTFPNLNQVFFFLLKPNQTAQHSTR